MNAGQLCLEEIQLFDKFIFEIPKSTLQFYYVWEYIQLKNPEKERGVERYGCLIGCITLNDKNAA